LRLRNAAEHAKRMMAELELEKMAE